MSSIEVMASQPLVSVITATYNATATLQACMESVQAQDYPNIEHVLVDGASTDGTLDILKKCAAANTRWISEPDKGIYDAWNKGLGLARGEWIAFLGADDVYLPGAVKAFMELTPKEPLAMYLSGRVRWIGPGGKPRLIGSSWRWPKFQRFMCTAHVGSMHHRSLFETYGLYDTSYRMTADYELLLRAKGNLKSAFLPHVVAEMQCGGATDSLKSLDEARRAKIESGGRPVLVAQLERWVAGVGFRSRRMIRKAGTLFL